MASPETLDESLLGGAEKARAISVPFLKEIKRKMGFRFRWLGSYVAGHF
jgi:tryptophanyl-tRNA synthetase